jgi:acyl dehydratase
MQVEEKIVVTKEIVENFSKLIGDFNPIHWDYDYAKKSKFGKPIVHGMLLASFFSKIIANKYPGEGSIYVSQNINFIKPCFIDDTIIIRIKLLSLDNNKYKISTQILNLNDQILVDGDALVIKN